MKDAEINIAIADACGWALNTEKHSAKCLDWINRVTGRTNYSYPDYCNDLNAMHEAEKMLRPPHWNDFSIWQIYLNYFEEDPHATARQRADAFINTLGKRKGGA